MIETVSLVSPFVIVVLIMPCFTRLLDVPPTPHNRLTAVCRASHNV